MVRLDNDTVIPHLAKNANKRHSKDTSYTDWTEIDWSLVDWSKFDWAKVNLFAHGNYFAATYYTSTKGNQRHILSTLASKLDVRKANPFDQIARYITLEELEFMTGVSQSSLQSHLNVLSGEVYKPLPSIDDGKTALWLDQADQPTREAPSKTQRRLTELFSENSCKIYIVRLRRQDEETGLNAATSYGVTSQMIDDYKVAIMTGKVVLNQDVNHDELVIAYDSISRGKPLKSPYPKIWGTENAIPQNLGDGTPKFGGRYPKIRGASPSGTQEQPARQGAFLTVDNSVDKEVDNNKPTKKIEPLERKRSGAVSSCDSSISKTALLGAISGVLKPTEKPEVSTLIRDTLLAKGFSRETLVKACEWIFQRAGMRRISHDPGKIHIWIEACQSIDAGDVHGNNSMNDLSVSEAQPSFDMPSLDIECVQREAEEAEKAAAMDEKAAREQAVLELDLQTVVSSCFETRKLRPLHKKKLAEALSIKDLMRFAKEDTEFKGIFETVVSECVASTSCPAMS